MRALFAHVRSNIVGYLALFVAMSGTAYAAATVGSAQVIDGSLRSVDLQNERAVGSVDVIPDSLGGAAIREASLAVAKVTARASASNISTSSSSRSLPLSRSEFTVSSRGIVNDVYTTLTFDPGTCSDNSTFRVLYYVDGVLRGQLDLNESGSRTWTKALTLPSPIFGTGTTSTHGLGVVVSDDCSSGHVLIKYVEMAVVELK